MLNYRGQNIFYNVSNISLPMLYEEESLKTSDKLLVIFPLLSLFIFSITVCCHRLEYVTTSPKSMPLLLWRQLDIQLCQLQILFSLLIDPVLVAKDSYMASSTNNAGSFAINVIIFSLLPRFSIDFPRFA